MIVAAQAGHTVGPGSWCGRKQCCGGCGDGEMTAEAIHSYLLSGLV
jgi:hypothetical protein